MTHPDAAHAAGGDRQALQPQLLLDTGGAAAGMGAGVVEDRSRNLGRSAVRAWSFRAREPVDQATRPIGLEIPPDFIELLPGITDHRNRCLGPTVFLT